LLLRRLLTFSFFLVAGGDLGPTDDTAQAAIQNAFTRSRSIASSPI
jgi:hypothetical protein